jgi:WD40 repeat protein
MVFLFFFYLKKKQSLSGHTTAIEAVRFSPTEELVCAGSAAGAVKVWDLEAARMVRTLTGHRAGIKALDFHPYGDFLATGSTDTNMKVNLHTFHYYVFFTHQNSFFVLLAVGYSTQRLHFHV